MCATKARGEVLGLHDTDEVDKHEEKILDNAVESLVAQVAMDSPLMQFLANQGGPDGKAVMPILFTMGHVIEEMHKHIGRLDARLHAIDGEP